MSLILEALRKSEAERKRGQAPGLFSPMPLPPSRRRRAPVWPMLASVIALIVLAVIAIRYWPDSANNDAPTTVDAPIAAPSTASAPDTAANTTASAPPAPAIAPVTTQAASPPAAVPAAAPPPPAPVVAAPESPTPALPAAAPVVAATEPAAEYLPSLASLPPDRRASLPPLKLSMHVWSEQPARRIAIIDGQRVSEGSSLSGAIVAEIRRDGVALEVDGQRYLLPRP